MIDLLPSYFNYMKPNLPVICNHYNVRNPKFPLPAIKHDFAKHLRQHCLIKLLISTKIFQKLQIKYLIKLSVCLNQHSKIK